MGFIRGWESLGGEEGGREGQWRWRDGGRSVRRRMIRWWQMWGLRIYRDRRLQVWDGWEGAGCGQCLWGRGRGGDEVGLVVSRVGGQGQGLVSGWSTGVEKLGDAVNKGWEVKFRGRQVMLTGDGRVGYGGVAG